MNSSEGEDSGDVSDSCVLPEESMADGFQQDHIWHAITLQSGKVSQHDTAKSPAKDTIRMFLAVRDACARVVFLLAARQV